MKKITLIIIGLIFSTTINFSQENEQNIKKSNLLGINIGATTGIGLSYKHWHDKLGIQITALPIKIKNDFDFSIGLTGFYMVRQRRLMNMFIYTGHNIMTDEFEFIYDMNPINSFINSYNRYDDFSYNASVGFGAELGKNPLITVMVGYGAFDILGDYKLFPTVDVGLHFRVK